jgi:hypothetical protein
MVEVDSRLLAARCSKRGGKKRNERQEKQRHDGTDLHAAHLAPEHCWSCIGDSMSNGVVVAACGMRSTSSNASAKSWRFEGRGGEMAIPPLRCPGAVLINTLINYQVLPTLEPRYSALPFAMT